MVFGFVFGGSHGRKSKKTGGKKEGDIFLAFPQPERLFQAPPHASFASTRD
jgi:hypothetical protein